tara:strand:+ start:145 stop:879 length:735 start_codon:yes stop_codon:yes gene_type:complete
MDINKLDYQKLVIYGVLLLIGVYFMRDMLDLNFKIPILETFEGQEGQEGQEATVGQPPAGQQVQEEDEVEDELEGELDEEEEEEEEEEVKQEVKQPVQQQQQVAASEPGENESYLPVQGAATRPSSCYPQNTLGPEDLLPLGKSKEIEDFNKQNPVGEGILKGVNFLDAGFHTGVNTVGQSLRNANLNLRAEPPNPRVQVSPWMNSTIDADLARKTLDSEDVCNQKQVGTEFVNPNQTDLAPVE